ncbi:MAG: PKD repeat protein [Flavobacteriaceae bacterium]|jgi:PKD repeat protein
MKRHLLGFVALAITSASYAQFAEKLNVTIINDIAPNTAGASKAATCGTDTVQYTLAKTTGFTALSINSATSAQAMSQYYNCPQPVTISGAQFYAYKIDVTGGTSINVGLSVYAAGLDSMPTGLPLASTTVAVDTNFGGGVLSVLSKIGNFTPITMSVPYVVVIENISPNAIGLIFNDYNLADGAGEWLCGVDLFGTWTRPYNVNVGGVPFDADLIVYPFVTYDLAAAFIPSDQCMSTGPTITFTNTSSPIVNDRMYNQYAYLGTQDLSYTWNYGDGSPTETLESPFHAFPTNVGPYDVLLTDTIIGWTSICTADTTITLGTGLTPNFGQSTAGTVATFTDLSTSAGTISGYLWDFGDGNISTTMSPIHTYALSGTYTVCLTVTDNCISDSTCQTVIVTGCSTPVAGFTISGTEPTYNFTNTSAITGSATYSWDFGDATTSTLSDPSHTFTSNGVWAVVLTVTDSCGTNLFTSTITTSTIGIAELPSVTVNAFPNPANEIITIISSAEITQVLVLDMSGKIVMTNKGSNSNETELDLRTISNGSYLVRVSSSNGLESSLRIAVIR